MSAALRRRVESEVDVRHVVLETSQFARHLAENGCQVVVPALVSRSC